MVIRRVGVWSVARMYGALSGGMGLIFGLILAVASVVGFSIAEGDEPAFVAAAMGVGAIIILPLFYGVLGLCVGAVGAFLYNLLAGIVGGVSVETE